MKLRFLYRRYCLPFRAPVRTAHGWWREREGLYVRIEDDAGVVGFGEAAPIPHFGTETIDEVEEGARAIGEWTCADVLAAVPARLGCLRRALAMARSAPREEPTPTREHLAVAGLLPAGRAALEVLPGRSEEGFRTFKWKVGVGDLADELSLLDDVCAALPAGARLRLDANGAWDRRQAERWLERCAERPVEFVEQPCWAPAAEGAGRQRKLQDVLLGLAGDFPTPLALDESLVGESDVERWIGLGWPGVYVIKPSLLADVPGVLAQLKQARATVVFSSALETALGAQAALRAALAWGGEPRAVGFGVWPLFQQLRFDGWPPAPFLRRSDVETITPESLWNAVG